MKTKTLFWVGALVFLLGLVVNDRCPTITLLTIGAIIVMAAILLQLGQKPTEAERQDDRETHDEPSGLVGLCRDQNNNLVVCLGLVEDGMAIVYDQSDPNAKTYTVFASDLVKFEED